MIAYNVITTPFNSDNFLVIFESNLSLKSESDNIITIFDFTHALNLTEIVPSPNGVECTNVRMATICLVDSSIYLRKLLKNTHQFRVLKKGRNE